MPVSNITEVSNSVTVGNVVSSVTAPAFVKSSVGLNSIYREDLPPQGQSNVKKFKKDGSLTAASLAESTAQAVDSNGEFTQTSVSATAAKCAVVSGLSVEGARFGTIDEVKLAKEAGAAVGRFVSNDILSLASGFSVTQTATAAATLADLYAALFSIQNSNCPNQEVLPHFICNPRSGRSIKEEIVTSGASAFNNPNMLSIAMGLPTNGGYLGQIPGLCEVYQTTGFAASGGNDSQPFVHPMWGIAGMFDSAPITWTANKGAEGFYTELATYYLYDVVEWNDLACVNVASDT